MKTRLSGSDPHGSYSTHRVLGICPIYTVLSPLMSDGWSTNEITFVLKLMVCISWLLNAAAIPIGAVPSLEAPWGPWSVMETRRGSRRRRPYSLRVVWGRSTCSTNDRVETVRVQSHWEVRDGRTASLSSSSAMSERSAVDVVSNNKRRVYGQRD